MHIQINAVDLSDCLSRITKVISSPDDIHIVVKNKLCRVSAQKEGFLVSLVLAAKCISDGECAIDFNSVKSVFRNRKTLELKLEKSQLMFKAQGSNAFAGNLVTLDYTKHKTPTLKNENKVSSEQMSFLSEVLKTLAIEDFYFKHPLSLAIFDKDGMSYACVASAYHMAIAEKKLKKVVPLSLPLKCMVSIVSVLSGSIQLSVDDSKVIAMNKAGDFVVNPLESMEQGPQKESILSVMNSFGEKAVAKEISVLDIQEVMSAFSALKTPEANSVSVEADKTGLKLSMKSSKGTLNNVVPCKVKSSLQPFSINPDMLNSFIRVSDKKSFSLIITDKAFCLKTEGDGLDVKYIGAFRL